MAPSGFVAGRCVVGTLVEKGLGFDDFERVVASLPPNLVDFACVPSLIEGVPSQSSPRYWGDLGSYGRFYSSRRCFEFQLE